MNETQALQILDSIAAKTQMSREAHDVARQAAQTLMQALRELVTLRLQIGQEQEDENAVRVTDIAASSSLHTDANTA